MKEIISAILLGISANLDNVLIGFSFGNRNKKIPFYYVLVICTIIALVTLIAVLGGNFISNYISRKFAKIICSVTLISIGIYSLFGIKKESDINEEVKNISFKTSVILAISLSLNNSIISLAGGMGGVNKLITTISTFFFSGFFLIFGNMLGRKINTKIIAIITSLLLILFGIYEYIY